MAVLRDYYCKAHGLFESFEATCPHGCIGECVQKIPSAPALVSNRTRFTSALTDDISKRYSMGTFQGGPRFEDFAGNFVSQTQAQTMMTQRATDVSQMMPEQMAEELATGFGKITPPNLREKTVAIQDPENLQIKLP